jgi:EpsD family peptidyl-prolyl cis-trans isomerase
LARIAGAWNAAAAVKSIFYLGLVNRLRAGRALIFICSGTTWKGGSCVFGGCRKFKWGSGMFMRGFSDFFAKPALVGVSLAVLLVAGCGKKEGERPPGQVIAHIGSDDVTVQELENEFRLANIPQDKRNDDLTRKALTEIVTRKAIARQAIAAKLDREPTIQLDLLREKEQMLARTFQQRKLSGEVSGIGQTDIDQFIATHPTQFAKRVVLVTDQVEIPAQAITPELIEATKKAKTLAEVEAKLNELKIPMRRGSGALDSATLPTPIFQQLLAVKGDDVFFTRVGNGAVFFKIVETQTKPLSGNDANNLARQLIAREKAEALTKKATEDAKKAATFEGDYVRIMKDAPAAADAPKN